ncbi:MAG: tetratricopeptide repeat protein [Planctomycetota bacterium]|jgi:tetratricopeptide (TPR) repeat protein
MNNSTDFQKYFDDGRYAFLNGDFEDCITSLSEALKLDPDHKLALVSRGSAYLKLNDTEAAVNDFNRVIEIDFDYARAYHLRGVAREQNEEYDSALADIRKAIEIDPEYGAAFYSRATLLTKLKREDEAVDDIQMVQFLTNKNIETFANENNVWRSQQLKLESMLESELER